MWYRIRQCGFWASWWGDIDDAVRESYEPLNTRKNCMELMSEEESYAIRGAIYEVYKMLGAGFWEGVYQEALECVFRG